MRILAVVLLAMTLTACAFTEDKVTVDYVAPPNIEVAPGAKDVSVAITANDARVANKDRISTKKNGYGIEMAAIRAENDVVQLVAQAVEHELSSLGFKIGTGQDRVKVSLDTFYNDFKVGFFSGDAVAEVAFTLTAYRPDGRIAYSRTYHGVGMEKDISLWTGENARLALQNALTNAMVTVIADKDLQKALVDAAAPLRPNGAPST